MQLGVIVSSLLYILPAWVANGTPPVVASILGRRRLHRIDFGYKLPDGNPLFGGNKTYEGFISAVASGSLAGYIVSAIRPDLYAGMLEPAALSLGAMLGDLLGSFIKRRLAIKPGECLILGDQLMFLIVALAVSYATFGSKSFLRWSTFLLILLATFAAHLATNEAFSRAVRGEDDPCWKTLSRLLRRSAEPENL